MSLMRKPLDWDLSVHINCATYDAKLFENDNIRAVVLMGINITSFLHYDREFNLLRVEKVECCDEIKDVIMIRNQMFMLDEHSKLYELVEEDKVQQVQKFDDGFCFESSESMEATPSGKCWKLVRVFDGSVLAISGGDNGFYCLRYFNNTTYLETFTWSGESCHLVACTQVSKGQSNGKHLIQTIKLSPTFQKTCFGVVYGSSDECLIFNLPCGLVSVLPAACQTQVTPILFEKSNKLQKIILLSNGDILLAYLSGKLVVVYVEEKKIKSTRFYLPEKISDISCFENDHIVWSDGLNIRTCQITNHSELSHVKSGYNIEGVTHLFSTSKIILSVTNQNCFYAIGMNQDKTVVSTESEKCIEDTLNEIYYCSQTIDKLQKKIETKAAMIYAYSTAKLANIEENFNVHIEENEVQIENKTGRCFSKEIWKVMLNGKSGSRNTMQIKGLQDDFENNTTLRIRIEWEAVEEVRILFLGSLNNHSDLLLIWLPKTCIPLKSEFFNVCETLKQMAETRVKNTLSSHNVMPIGPA